MGADPNDTTPARAVLGAYESLVSLGTATLGARASAPELDLAAEAVRLREAFMQRTGSFGPEDPWFEARARAFWDDALTGQGFGRLAAPHAGPLAASLVEPLSEAHRGLFVIADVEGRRAHLIDRWSGAELLVELLDDAQRLAMTHAEGPFDARVVRGPEREGISAPPLFVLPGAFHHVPDASAAIEEVLAAARGRGLTRDATLDALLRMDHVFRASSRVKIAFAYRVESLPRG